MQLTQQTIYEMAPFAQTLGVEFSALEPERVRAELATDPSLSTTGGGLHGGAIMSLCDLAGAVCVGLNVSIQVLDARKILLCRVRERGCGQLGGWPVWRSSRVAS